MTAPSQSERDRMHIEYLQNEVARLRGLVDQLARFRKPVFVTEPDPYPDEGRFGRGVDYKIELRVPGWQLLTLRSRLDLELWDQEFWPQVFDEFANRAHLTLVGGIKKYKEEHP